MTTSDEAIEAAARAAHEANRAYCIALGDESQLPWDETLGEIRMSARNGVRGVILGSTPEGLHELWLEEKKRMGWTYGETKCVEEKTHPCMRAYEELPPAQRAKDSLFLAVVQATLVALRTAAGVRAG